MNFKLAIVGHKESIKEITGIIHHKFNNIDVTQIEFNNDDDLPSVLVKLSRIMAHTDGILYTRYDPFRLVTARLEHSVPSRYVDVDASTLVFGLFSALYHQNIDIMRISIDSLDYAAVKSAYTSVGIPFDKVSLQHVNTDLNAEHFVKRVAAEHLHNYNSGLCNVCVSNIRSVVAFLHARNVPAILLSPTEDAYVYEIRRLMLSARIRQQDESKTVVIAAALLTKDNIFTYTKTPLQTTLERNKATEQLAVFAQAVDGALLCVGTNEHYIVCDSMALESVTVGLTKLEFLAWIARNTMFFACVGIGYGDTAKTAQINAQSALARTVNEGGNRAYVVYSSGNIVGPIEPNEAIDTSGKIFETRLIEISDKTGLSINTVYRIDALISQMNTRNFTAVDLSTELGVSIRTANRIINQLETAGFVSEVSRHVVSSRGRPTRVVKITF